MLFRIMSDCPRQKNRNAKLIEIKINFKFLRDICERSTQFCKTLLKKGIRWTKRAKIYS